MGDRDAGQAQGGLDERGGDVADDQDDDLVDDGGTDAEHDVIEDDGDHGTREGEVPVVPDVDVGRLGGVGDQHHDVDQQAQRDDDRADHGTHGDGGGGGPAHVHHGQGQAEARDHRGDGTGEVGTHQVVDDQVQADEADAHGEAGLEALAEARAEGAADDREDDGHDDRDAKALNAPKESNNCIHSSVLSVEQAAHRLRRPLTLQS